MTESRLEATVDLSAVPRRSLRVVSRVVAGEHILVPLASRGAQIDSVFNLNDTGTFIWDRIDGRKTGAEIAAMVAADFQVSADRAGADCGEFLSQLLEARAIDLVEPSEAVKR